VTRPLPTPLAPPLPYTTLFRSDDLRLERADPARPERLAHEREHRGRRAVRQQPPQRASSVRLATQGPGPGAVHPHDVQLRVEHRSEEHTAELQSRSDLVWRPQL